MIYAVHLLNGSQMENREVKRPAAPEPQQLLVFVDPSTWKWQPNKPVADNLKNFSAVHWLEQYMI